MNCLCQRTFNLWVLTLVTGSNGYLGSRFLRRQGQIETLGFDQIPGANTDIVGSLQDATIRKATLQGCKSIVHLAGLHAPHVATHSEANFVAINVNMTEGLIEDSIHAGVERFVFPSSTSVYGDAIKNPQLAFHIDEMVVPVPRDIYDKTKLAAERIVLDASKRFSRGSIVLRIGRCFREDAKLRFWYRFYRGISAHDVISAIQIAELQSVSGIFNIVSRTKLVASDAYLLSNRPLEILSAKYPAFESQFNACLPFARQRIDRIYCGTKAAAELGFQSRHDTISWQARFEPLT